LRDVQLRLERLRRQKEFAQDKMGQAEEALSEARELYRKGLYGEAYDMIIKANARMNAAKAASLLAVGDKTSAELEQELDSISGHMHDMEFEVNMEMSMGQARKAIDFVDGKLGEIKKHMNALDDSLSQAENLLEFAKKHYQAGDYQKAFNLAVDAAEQAELVLPVEVLGGEAAAYRRAGGVSSGKKRAVRSGTYTVRKKDNLWRIAERADVYGDPLLWPVLYKANQPRIKNPDVIQAGWVLTVPRAGDLKKIAQKNYKAARKKSVKRKKRGTPVPAPRDYRKDVKPRAKATPRPDKIKVVAPRPTATAVIAPTTAPTPEPIVEEAVAPPTETPLPAPTAVPEPAAPALPSIDQLAEEAIDAPVVTPEAAAEPEAPPLPMAAEQAIDEGLSTAEDSTPPELPGDTKALELPEAGGDGAPPEIPADESGLELPGDSEGFGDEAFVEESDPALDALLGRLNEGTVDGSEESSDSSLEDLLGAMESGAEPAQEDSAPSLEGLLDEMGGGEAADSAPDEPAASSADDGDVSIDFSNF